MFVYGPKVSDLAHSLAEPLAQNVSLLAQLHFFVSNGFHRRGLS